MPSKTVEFVLPFHRHGNGISGLIEALSKDPSWNGGDYFTMGGVEQAWIRR